MDIDFTKEYDFSSFEELKKKYPDINPYYLRYRCDKEIWNNILSMYEITKDFLDKDFENKFILNKLYREDDFLNRLWELMVAYALISEEKSNESVNFLKKSKDLWPDFEILYQGEKVYIECICAGNEDKQRNPYNSSPQLQWDKDEISIWWAIYEVDRPFKLRIGSAIFEKLKKFNSYIESWVINSESILIIAVSIESQLIFDIERIMNWLLYWVGNQIFKIKKNNKLSFHSYEYISHINKIKVDGTTELIKNLFWDQKYDIISMIMFHDILVFKDEERRLFWLGNFRFFHNNNPDSKKTSIFEWLWLHFWKNVNYY